MNKLTRITSAATAGVLAACAFTGCSPYSNPGKYIDPPEKGEVTLKKSDIDKAYEDEIYDILDSTFRDTVYTELTDESEKVKDGDQVSIRYTGRAADSSVTLSEDTLKKMTNADADEDTELVIGSDSFIGAYENEEDESKNTEGFEEQLIGWTKGQSGDITVTFPDDYDTAELQGVVVIFNVTINKISRAYVADDSTVTVSYEFEEASEEDAGESEDASEDAGESAAASETAADDTAEAPETAEDELPALSDVFKKSTFSIDYTKDLEDNDTFNDLFSVKDYADLFKSQPLFFEHSFEHTVTEEDAEIDEKYEDYIGRTFTVKLSVTEITSLPEWTDDLVSEYTDEEYTTVADFEEYLRTSITAEQALEAIVEKTTVKSYPEGERDKIYKQYVNSLVANELGADPSTMTQKEVDALLTDEKYAEIYASAATSTLIQLKQTLVYEYLFDFYDIELSSKEYKEQLDEMLNANLYMFMYYYGIYDTNSLESYYGKDNLELQFKANKLAEKLGDYVTIDEAN